MERADAARFSFLLGFPLILAASLTGLTDVIGANDVSTETSCSVSRFRDFGVIRDLVVDRDPEADADDNVHDLPHRRSRRHRAFDCD